MSDSAFIRFGHGYETGSPGRCEAFDGFEIIAAPLGEFGSSDRESRHFPRKDGGAGVTYASHAIKLAKMPCARGELYILMSHGGGREVLRVPAFYDNGTLAAAILVMPERLQYALLYTIWHAAKNARHEAQGQTRAEWASAFCEKRLRKRRRNHRVFVEIEAKAEAKAA